MRITGELRRAGRAASLVVVLAWGVFLAGVLMVCPPATWPVGVLRRHWLALVTRTVGARVRVHGKPAGAGLFVANHVSWLDIPVLGSVAGLAFVSKREVRRWPVVGWLAARGGTEFIQRGNPHSARMIGESLSRRLASGDRVLVFPEGTTTAGETVARFRPRLFGAATAAGVAVQPVTVRYRGGAGRLAPFIGDDGLASHLWRLLRAPSIPVDIMFHPPIRCAFERRELAALAQCRVADGLAWLAESGTADGRHPHMRPPAPVDASRAEI
jgi:1-acyl-sn-glycerol-3-phosphate acyltransferase